MIGTVQALEQHGWTERPAVGLARARSPGWPLSVVERGDATLFVVGVARAKSSAFVLVAGTQLARDDEEAR